MNNDPIAIRRVTVEFLRPGPSHNQLLSPYTQYLAVCNDAGAAVVTVPYEHRVFERRLKELRYETGDESDRLDMLHEIGRDMGRLLESVPGLPGAMAAEPGRPTCLVHLRLTVSAAELAYLPFELAQVPVGSTASAVSVQPRPPVVVTRHIRTVSSERVQWPERPRILFIASDTKDVPFDDHRKVLVDAITPFLYPGVEATTGADGAEQFGDSLTILVGPTVARLRRECEANAFTHIHVLTHGGLGESASESYGIVLQGEDGESDVVLGTRFVSAITPLGRLPSVVTIASCDSGNIGTVATPGASLAHALHQAGIPLVVGSQFPLSKKGSVSLTKRLYEGFLWGEHPLHVLQRARGDLHARFDTQWHDWASLVAYESLPPDLEHQIEALRYSQARRALNASLERIDRAVDPKKGSKTPEKLPELMMAVTVALDRLPGAGQYAVECLGLQASSRKRMAQAAFTFETQTDSATVSPIGQQHELLDEARARYAQAVRGMLVNTVDAVQRKATLHWVLVQLVSLAEVLGREPKRGEWEAAWLAAEHYVDHRDHEERAWAQASLAELSLLRLAEPRLSDDERATFAADAVLHARELDAAYPREDSFPVKSTRRQFERYANWWGTSRFRDSIPAAERERHSGWSRQPDGLVETARRLAAILARSGPGSASGGTSGAGAAPVPPADPAPEPIGGEAPAHASAQTAPAADPTAAPDLEPSPLLGPPRQAPTFRIEALPAGHGDCLWIEYGDEPPLHRILIDCGTQGSAKTLVARVGALPANERVFDLFVMTHIDADHIGGALALLREVKHGLRLGDVWFNGWRHVSGELGARQAEMFSTAIQDLGLPWNQWRDGDAITTGGDEELPEHRLPDGMKLTLLSPTPASLAKLGPVWKRELKRHGLEPGGRVDYGQFLKGTPSTIADAAALLDIDALADSTFTSENGAPNGSSIAVLAEYRGKSVLLAADAHAPVLIGSIKALLAQRGLSRLELDLLKVSHHGSQNNLNRELLELIECPRYLISTNGDHFYHPDRQAIARIFKYGGERKELFFNYNNRLTEVWGSSALARVRERYRCETRYPAPDRPGIAIAVL